MVNKVIFIGRCGGDPERRYTAEGLAVSTFSFAVSKSWKNKQGGKQETTIWLRVVAWGKLADVVADYITKGKLLYVEGELDIRDYEAKDGTKKKDISVKASTIQMIGGKTTEKNTEKTSNKHDDDFVPETEEDDVPL